MAEECLRQTKSDLKKAECDLESIQVALGVTQDELETERAQYEETIHLMKSRCEESETRLKKAEAERDNAERVTDCAYEAAEKSGNIADGLRVEIAQLRGEEPEGGLNAAPTTLDLLMEKAITDQKVAILQEVVHSVNPELCLQTQMDTIIGAKLGLQSEVKELTGQLEDAQREIANLAKIIEINTDEVEGRGKKRTRRSNKESNKESL